MQAFSYGESPLRMGYSPAPSPTPAQRQVSVSSTPGLQTITYTAPAPVELVATPRQTVGAPRASLLGQQAFLRQEGQAVSIASAPAVVLTTGYDPAKGSLRAPLQDPLGMIKELERRLAQSNLALAERENRIAELTRTNQRLRGINEDKPTSASPKPKAKAKAKRRSSSQRSDSAERDRSGLFSGRSNRDELEEDDIDQAIRHYLAERPEVQVELTKVRKGWYMVKPLGKKVFMKVAGKDKLVVRVGGGYVSFEKFIDDFRPEVNEASRQSIVASNVRRSESR